MALAQLPEDARPRPGDPDSPRVLARSDSAGATHLFAAACRKEGAGFSFGFPAAERVQAIAVLIPDQCWHPAVEYDGGGIHQEEAGAVKIVNSIFAGNLAGSSNGGGFKAFGSSDTITIINSPPRTPGTTPPTNIFTTDVSAIAA